MNEYGEPWDGIIERTRQTVAWLRERGALHIALGAIDASALPPDRYLQLTGADSWVAPPNTAAAAFSSTPAETEADAVVVVDQANFPLMMRRVERICAMGKVIVPADPAWVVPEFVKTIDHSIAAWHTSSAANYLARNALTGHYLEFGTFWGGQFFPMGMTLHPILQGKSFAFDSFAGLSDPMTEESDFTGGEFSEGAYACNIQSFQAIADLVEFPRERLEIISGFFSETLVGKSGADYGIAPRSVSYCVVDCDIYEPTLQVLEFVLPLLDDGALIYFDDWRLGRGSPRSGERGAALEWLRRHPEIELLDFPGDSLTNVSHWQHAWFIFHRV